ncbi:MAG: thiamine-monophosphate kinase [Rhodocyclaceae bacterium]|nr:thiamine-monophosphate kinase [Rhodocyclaceae bacterium]
MPSEFALIDRYFRRAPRDPAHTVLGVGDDGAIVRPSPGCELVISTDMLMAGTHFLPDTDPADLGWKTLAVNVSDLAAMGALPRWALLAAALPEANEAWIEKFAQGFFACADSFGIDVIGGDTTKSPPVDAALQRPPPRGQGNTGGGPACFPGPRVFCVTIFGEVPTGTALLRSGAAVGDEIWVSGHPGRAALGLAHLQGRTVLSEPALTDCLAALHRPQPRVALGLALRGLATAAIDVSDGLLADLGHILKASNVAARLQPAVLPAPTIERDSYLAGGDDYELVFTVPAARHAEVAALSTSLALPLARIGTIESGSGLSVFDPAGQALDIARRGYDHFS